VALRRQSHRAQFASGRFASGRRCP
jgi:hypothetical protein